MAHPAAEREERIGVRARPHEPAGLERIWLGPQVGSTVNEVDAWRGNAARWQRDGADGMVGLELAHDDGHDRMEACRLLDDRIEVTESRDLLCSRRRRVRSAPDDRCDLRAGSLQNVQVLQLVGRKLLRA